jgi:hypothetical protein
MVQRENEVVHPIGKSPELQDRLEGLPGLEYAFFHIFHRSSGVPMRLFAAALTLVSLSSSAALASSASLSPTAATLSSPTAKAAPAQLSPSAAAALTATAADLSPSADVQDDEVSSTAAVLDLGKAETKLLASIAEATGNEDEKFLYNLEENQRSDHGGRSVAEVDVVALYAELATRAVNDDAEARKALGMAQLRGDKRAVDAKQQAFDDKLASSVIKRIENGDQGAKADLEKLALKGNDKARAYLGLDKTTPVGIPEAMSGTAAKASGLSGTAQPLSPSSK